MKAALVALSLIAPLAVVATPAAAQQDPDERARIEELTRRLNGAPPVPQSTAPSRPASAPATHTSATQTSVAQTSVTQAPAGPAARQDPEERARIEELTRRLNGAPPRAGPGPVSPPRPTPAPAPQRVEPIRRPPASAPAPAAVQPQSQPRPAQPAQEAPVRRSTTTQAPPASAAPATPRPAPSAPAPQGLSAAERAALPFRIDLPPGFQLVEGRSGPNAHVYSARKAGKTYLMVYAGPSSQFPIYDGEQVTAGGRISVVTTEGPRRIAMEHLFQRSAQPAEIHVWVMAQDGADRDEAERIAQTVDPK